MNLPTPEVAPDGEVRGRPYLATGGRTRARDASLSIETVVVAPFSAGDRHQPRSATWSEHARILAECREPRSVAEVAARLGLPLTVVLVLVGDLVADGHLLASSSLRSAGGNVDFLERLIAGVAAL